MPPKSKDAPKKVVAPINRPQISNASLNYIPDDALEGYQERIETGVNWTIDEEAARYNKQSYRDHVAEISFSEALQTKISKSILYQFLNKDSKISLQEQWETILQMTMWDNEKFSNDEGRICFRNDNNITENLMNIIKKTVIIGDRSVLERDLKDVSILRVNGCKMTKLDEGLTGFQKLVRLNLCGNFLNEIDASIIPRGVRALELQSNFIETVESVTTDLPPGLLYLGLAKNLLGDVTGLQKLSESITVLDISDNDIYDLEFVLDALSSLPSLISLQLAGNPCAVCAAYARATLLKLPQLQWLDLREVLSTDLPLPNTEIHPHDFRSTYFNFFVFRVISAPQPPKGDKGAVMTFHVELELPFLDSTRRGFLMFRHNESLIEMLPPPEDDIWEASKVPSVIKSKSTMEVEGSSHESDVFKLTTVDSREIHHYTTFESNKVQWNKIMNFQEPAVRIFCPNLVGLRDTFRTVVTVRLIYTMTIPVKQGKTDKKSAHSLKPVPIEQRATIATIKCILKRPDWTQNSQHFHWDDSLGTNEAIHWGDGDLSTLQYSQTPAKVTKGKMDSDPGSSRQQPPENLTCHFGFGIDTLRQ